MGRRGFDVVARLLGAVMLGVGTLLQTKARPDDHWSTSPKVQLEVEAADEVSGDPPRR